MKQHTLKGFEKYGKTTRRAQFLADMDRIIPWPEMTAAVQTVYPKISENGGRPPIPLERMLRIYFLQLWFNLSDPAVEEALYDSVSMRSFVGIDLGMEGAPDETTVCKFRHLLERNELGKTLLKAVNDHLRILSSQHPLDVESGGIHQVKPWFEGRLDFAPVVRFDGDQDFPLRGGAVGYYLDRKAAVFVFGRRLHAISLLVFRADGLPWPSGGREEIGGVPVHVTTSRGFTSILWRDGELGYALVSDVEPADLTRLAERLVPRS